jgi:hypothetical protein
MHTRSTSKAVVVVRSLIRREISWFERWDASEIKPGTAKARWTHGISSGNGMSKQRNEVMIRVSSVTITISWAILRELFGAFQVA